MKMTKLTFLAALGFSIISLNNSVNADIIKIDGQIDEVKIAQINENAQINAIGNGIIEVTAIENKIIADTDGQIADITITDRISAIDQDIDTNIIGRVIAKTIGRTDVIGKKIIT